MKIVAILLIVFGVIGLAYGGITWTRREKVIDAGPIHVSTDRHSRFPLPPVVGGVLVAAGAVLLLSTNRRAV